MVMSDREKIKGIFYEIVSDVLDISADKITEDMGLIADLNIDSLALYEIVVEVEEKYSLRISNDEADNLSTVKEAIDYILESVRRQNRP